MKKCKSMGYMKIWVMLGILVILLQTQEVMGQPSTPSDARVVATNATTITYEIRDPDGVGRVNAYYGISPGRPFSETTVFENCPQMVSVTISKSKIGSDGNPHAFSEMRVVDWSANQTGLNVATFFDINAEGIPTVGLINEAPPTLENLTDEMRKLAKRIENLRLLQFVSIVLLIVFFILFWRAFGPFFKRNQ